VWRTRRWARDLPDLVLVGTPFERWSALGRRRSRPAGAAPLQGTARPTVAACTAQLATAQPARHRNTARRDSVRVGTTRHGTAQHAWRRNTARNETGRNGAPRQVSARHGTARDRTGQRDSAGLAPHGTPIPTQERTAGLGTARHPRGTRGTANLGTTRHAHPGTGGEGEPRHHGTPSTAWHGVARQPGTSRHRRSVFGVRYAVGHGIGARDGSTPRTNDRTPRRESDGAFWWTCGGVSRW